MSKPIDSLGLLTSCSPKDVHAALTLTKVLPVTFEDLSNFPGSSKSIWPLIGAQLLRLASKQPSRARTQYYRALIQSAMSSQKQRTGRAEEHVELYARHLNIQCLSASIGDDGITARFRSTVGRTLGEQNSAREYTLVFQSQHVRISSIHV